MSATSMMTPPEGRDKIMYPHSDAQPMADHAVQACWIMLLKENLDVVASNFVAMDLLWDSLEGQPKIRAAPDVRISRCRP